MIYCYMIIDLFEIKLIFIRFYLRIYQDVELVAGHRKLLGLLFLRVMH